MDIISFTMQYVIVVLAFLAQSTLSPAYIEALITVEILTIAYFAIILKTKYTINVYIPATLLLIANIITQNVIGLQSIALMFAALVCNAIFLGEHKRASLFLSHRKTLDTKPALFAFALSFLVFTVVRWIGLVLLGYSPPVLSHVIYYLFNLLIFFIITICI